MGLSNRSGAARLRLVRHRRPRVRRREFLADLQWWSPVAGIAARAQGAFLDSYGAETGEGRLERARVYEALTLVMLAAHRVPLYHPGWAERTARLVRRAGAVLDELPRARRRR